MNGRPRKPHVPVEATQELQALDVLEIVEALRPPGSVKPRRPTPSNSSIAPVGLDLAPDAASGDEEANPTMEIRLPAKRRRLAGVVIGALSGCAIILVAAAIARVGHAGSPPGATVTLGSPTDMAPATTTAAAAPPTPTVVPIAASPRAAATPAPATTATDPGSASSTGTVRLDRPAAPGRVWLDGKRLGSSSALVTCGTHQIRVGRGRTHSIDVPCGGEIGVSR